MAPKAAIDMSNTNNTQPAYEGRAGRLNKSLSCGLVVAGESAGACKTGSREVSDNAPDSASGGTDIDTGAATNAGNGCASSLGSSFYQSPAHATLFWWEC